MKKNAITLLMAATFVIAVSVVAGIAKSTDADIPAPPAIGATIEDFTLPDAEGKEHSLASLKGKNNLCHRLSLLSIKFVSRSER